MSYLGDRLPGDIIDFKFMTVGSTGSPVGMTTLTLGVYKDNGTTESSAGVTVTLGFDARTGLQHVRITTASDGTFYSAGSDYSVHIITQTPATPNLLGYIVGEFSLSNRVPNLAQTEPPQGAPPVNASVASMINYLYKSWRNRKTQTATTWSLYNDDATTVGQKATVSDDGTTATKGEIATGP